MNNERAHILTANYVGVKRAYLDSVFLPAFGRATSSFTPVERQYFVAGKHIRLLFCSSEFARKLAPALQHNEEPLTGSVDLTVHLWDSASTGVEFLPPWSKPDFHFDQQADAQKEMDAGFLGAYLHGENTLTLYDQSHATAYFWVQDFRELPQWVVAAPLRTLLHWFLSQHGTHLLHGAAVAIGESAILLTAKGGSGKSTTALSCLLSGMGYLADDYIAVRLAEQVDAYSLYSSIKVSPDRAASLLGGAAGQDGEKAVVFLSKTHPSQLISRARLKAILVPRVAQTATSTIHPISKAQAMIALLPTTLLQLPLAQSGKLGELRQIIDRLPCYRLDLGVDQSEVAQVVRNFVQSV